MKAHVRRQQYTYKGRHAYTWAVFVTNHKGKTLYSDNGFKTQQLAMRAGLFDIAAREHIRNCCAGDRGLAMRHHPHRPDRIAAGIYLAAFLLIFTALTTAAVAVALITTGRLA